MKICSPLKIVSIAKSVVVVGLCTSKVINHQSLCSKIKTVFSDPANVGSLGVLIGIYGAIGVLLIACFIL